jgi:hypothetical protein
VVEGYGLIVTLGRILGGYSFSSPFSVGNCRNIPQDPDHSRSKEIDRLTSLRVGIVQSGIYLRTPRRTVPSG